VRAVRRVFSELLGKEIQNMTVEEVQLAMF
jgi:hypothetical protein